MFNPFSLEGKRILVTGASSGIGRGVAITCSKMGAQMVLNGRNQERLDETLSMLEGEGHLAVAADLSTQKGIDYLVEKCPVINGMVHCAGVLYIGMSKMVDREKLFDIMNVNACSPILMTSLLLKTKKIQKGSSLVFISSLSGVVIGGVGEVMYSATKGALSGYVKTAALELSSKSIRVNAICPALVPTNLSREYHDIVPEDVLKSEISDKYPLKRMGTPNDVANASVFLLSEASSWITGINLILDGGVTLK